MLLKSRDRHVTERAFKWSKSRGRVKASRDPYERGYVDKKHVLRSLRNFLLRLVSAVRNT